MRRRLAHTSLAAGCLRMMRNDREIHNEWEVVLPIHDASLYKGTLDDDSDSTRRKQGDDLVSNTRVRPDTPEVALHASDYLTLTADVPWSTSGRGGGRRGMGARDVYSPVRLAAEDMRGE